MASGCRSDKPLINLHKKLTRSLSREKPGRGATPALTAHHEGTEIDHNREGAYLGIGIAHAWPSFGENIGDNDENWHSGMGMNARGGYRFNHYLAAEADVDFINRFSAKERLGPNNTIHNAIPTTATTFNVKAILPLDWIQPYVMGGIGFQVGNLQEHVGNLRTTQTNYNFAGRVAAGLELMLLKNWGWRIEVGGILPAGDSFGTDDNLNQIILNTGLRYAF